MIFLDNFVIQHLLIRFSDTIVTFYKKTISSMDRTFIKPIVFAGYNSAHGM